jgi:hypothetical protein
LICKFCNKDYPSRYYFLDYNNDFPCIYCKSKPELQHYIEKSIPRLDKHYDLSICPECNFSNDKKNKHCSECGFQLKNYNLESHPIDIQYGTKYKLLLTIPACIILIFNVFIFTPTKEGIISSLVLFFSVFLVFKLPYFTVEKDNIIFPSIIKIIAKKYSYRYRENIAFRDRTIIIKNDDFKQIPISKFVLGEKNWKKLIFVMNDICNNRILVE